MNNFLEVTETDDNYIRWRNGLLNILEILGLEYPKIIGDIAYPSPSDEFIGRGYDLRKMWNDFKEAD